MIKCKICGIERKCSLVHHIKKEHKDISISLYKEIYGETIDVEYRKEISNKQKNNWNDKNYRNNISNKLKEKWADKDFYNMMCEKRKLIYQTDEWRDKSKVWFDRYHNKYGSWNKGLTKETDSRIRAIGEANSKRIKGTKNPKHSKKMKEVWKKLKEDSPELYKQYNEKRSKTLSKLISEGKIELKSKHFKTGWYNNFYYASSYELEAMKFFDKLNLQWTNRHKIRLSYISATGTNKMYVPDFLVNIIGNDYVIEMKGNAVWAHDENSKLKIKIGKETYGEYYCIFYSVKELKEFVSGKFENKENN